MTATGPPRPVRRREVQPTATGVRSATRSPVTDRRPSGGLVAAGAGRLTFDPSERSFIRTATKAATPAVTTAAVMMAMGVRPSVPALSPWIVLNTNSGKLRKCTLFQSRWLRCLRTSDVTSTAASR